MAFDYDKLKRKQESDHQWSSYSDLFMALSVIFLLLYVTSSLRQGTFGVQKHMEYKRLSQQVEDLQEQLRVYNTLKEDYMKTGASEEEAQVYSNLMDKLKLLKEEAKDEKEELRRQAKENEQKEVALNKYQQMIRNIINSNLVAQARIQRREKIIETKEEDIAKKRQEIVELERTVNEKQKALTKNEQKISRIENQLDAKIKELKSTYKRHKMSKKKLNARIAKLRQQSQREISELESKSQAAAQQLQSAKGQLESMSQELEGAKSKIAKESEKSKQLEAQLQQTASKYAAQMEEVKEQYEKQRQQERKAFEERVKQQKLSALARAKKEAEFAQQMAAKKNELQSKLDNLSAKMQGTQVELKKAKALANARRELAKEIKKNLAQAGIKADVNAETGDVTLDFGDHYFNTGSAKLKPEMRKIIQKAMPVYSKSLFGNSKVADKVRAVEIIGFASPTYKGKYVDPSSLKGSDRKAVNYNLDLSYQRARSIFQHVFDTDKMKFRHQKRLLPLVKVTGRSFLAESKNKNREIASGMDQKKFCQLYDCEKAQKVIIKFDLDSK